MPSLEADPVVRVLGWDMQGERQRALPFMNFSSPYVDLPRRLTVRENLMVYAHLYGLKAAARRIETVARDLDMVPFLDRPFGNLSAGQKTRVSLAKALINEPTLLLLDEPTASLDPDTADWVRAYLEADRRQTGATLLLASHNMAEVESLAWFSVFLLAPLSAIYLSGRRPARLAAAGRLVPAVRPRVRGHAGGLVRGDVPLRPVPRRRRAERPLSRGGRDLLPGHVPGGARARAAPAAGGVIAATAAVTRPACR